MKSAEPLIGASCVIMTSRDASSDFPTTPLCPAARWHFAGRTLFWTAVISLALLAARLLLRLVFFRTRLWREGGNVCTLLTSPRLELFLLLAAVPGVSQACTVLVRGTDPDLHTRVECACYMRCNP